jgi:hypothetical protein
MGTLIRNKDTKEEYFLEDYYLRTCDYSHISVKTGRMLNVPTIVGWGGTHVSPEFGIVRHAYPIIWDLPTFPEHVNIEYPILPEDAPKWVFEVQKALLEIRKNDIIK